MAGGKRGKDDRQQNTLAPFNRPLSEVFPWPNKGSRPYFLNCWQLRDNWWPNINLVQGIQRPFFALRHSIFHGKFVFIFLILSYLSMNTDTPFTSLHSCVQDRARIFKLLRSSRINSREPIPLGSVAFSPLCCTLEQSKVTRKFELAAFGLVWLIQMKFLRWKRNMISQIPILSFVPGWECPYVILLRVFFMPLYVLYRYLCTHNGQNI